MASNVKWIKVVTDFFDDEKIQLIETVPSADSIIVIWFKLLTLAGKSNNNGVFMLSDRIPYTDEMLATIFRRDVNLIRAALTTFQKFGMIEIIDGVVTIPNWEKHQNTDFLEKKRAYDKEYQRKKREEQKKLVDNNVPVGNITTENEGKIVRLSSDVVALERERELERDNILIVSDDTICEQGSRTTGKEAIQRVVEEWNTLDEFGVKPVSRISLNSQRGKMLNVRIKQFGIDDVLKAIDNIRHSPFLIGRTKNPWLITFDWFVKPNNFIKVLDGNYLEPSQMPQNGFSSNTGGNTWQ